MSIINTHLRQRLLERVTNNVALKLLALGFAITIWTWVHRQQVVESSARVQVFYSWPEGLVPAEDVPRTLLATVRGPTGLVRTLGKHTLQTKLDLRQSIEGPVSVDFTARSISGVPLGLEVVQVSPPGLDFTLDQRMTRQVRVKPSLMGDPNEGWKRVGLTITPEIIEITGPISLVRNMAEVATDLIDISGVREDRTIEVPLAITNRAVSATTKTMIKVVVDVEPIIAERTFNEVPVMVRAPGWKGDAELGKVTLAGPVQTLSELKPDEINIVAHLPEDATNKPVTVTFVPNSEKSPIEVLHKGPKKQIRVIHTDPPSITLSPVPGTPQPKAEGG